ncbi:hypothetical protein CDL15_Pgr028195 [Punica granatum]|uniref:Uncharacterized protein n=1 Tax=Punica granatum TaxID=22663 RepID=A0A218XGZ5_PUNGR|nr:hypothetical protein CDL15_Pgr028195 [Punica granatum]
MNKGKSETGGNLAWGKRASLAALESLKGQLRRSRAIEEEKAEVEKEDGAGEVRGCHFHGAVLMHRAENERVGSDGFVDDDESDDDADETKMEVS